MKNLIIYCSKYGATSKVAKKIATLIKNFDMSSLEKFEQDLDDYDTIYLGCPIYYGRLNKSFKKFINSNKETLLRKDVRFFILGIDDKNFNQTVSNNIDQELLDHSSVVWVGGSYEYEKMSFFDRFITKRVARFDTSVDLIDDEKIKELIKK